VSTQADNPGCSHRQGSCVCGITASVSKNTCGTNYGIPNMVAYEADAWDRARRQPCRYHPNGTCSDNDDEMSKTRRDVDMKCLQLAHVIPG
jgi:hypothetical protein